MLNTNELRDFIGLLHGRKVTALLAAAADEIDRLRIEAGRGIPIIPGDYFTHDETGIRFVCRSVTRMDTGRMKILDVVEIITEAQMTPNGEVRGASRLAGEASSREAATSTVVLDGRETT